MSKRKRVNDVLKVQILNNPPELLGNNSGELRVRQERLHYQAGICRITTQASDDEGDESDDDTAGAAQEKKPDRIRFTDYCRNVELSLEYRNTDIIETTLFKALGKMDQEKVDLIFNNANIDEMMKKQSCGIVLEFALSCRDLELVKFLHKNGVRLDRVFCFISCVEEINDVVPSLRYVLVNSITNRKFDKELIDYLIDHGVPLEERLYQFTAFSYLIYYAPEEYVIGILDKIKNYSGIDWDIPFDEEKQQYDIVQTSSYLMQSLEERKYKLAIALVEKGADINYSYSYNAAPVSAWQIVYENKLEDVARAMIKTGKLDDGGFDESSKAFYERIQCQVKFQANSELNLKSIEDDSKIYSIDSYKKLALYNSAKSNGISIANINEDDQQEVQFYSDISCRVWEAVRTKIIYNWSKILLICKEFVVHYKDDDDKEYKLLLPEEILAEIGTYVCDDLFNEWMMPSVEPVGAVAQTIVS